MSDVSKKALWNSYQLAWFAIWALFTSLGVLLHALAWIPPDRLDAGLSLTSEWPFVKAAANALDAFTGPIWFAMNMLTGDWGVFSLVQSVIAHGITVAALLWVGRALLRIRRRFIDKIPHAANTEVTPLNPSRRRFLIDAPLSAAGILGSAALAHAGLREPFDLRVRRYAIPIADLPNSFNGFKAVFIADTHLGPRIPAAFIRRAVAASLDLRPDLFLLGGDYVHAGSRYIRPASDLFKPLVDSGIPTVGVLGNHDWYNSRGLIGRYLSKLGIRMVDNAHVMLDARTRRILDGPAVPGESLCIAGVGDFLTDDVDIHRALFAVPSRTPRIVLCHNPDAVDLAPMQRERIDLVLCGHTHGGQVALPVVGPMYIPCRSGTRYAGGLIKGPGFPVLVSRGVGMSICPIRFGVPPELVEITFVPA